MSAPKQGTNVIWIGASNFGYLVIPQPISSANICAYKKLFSKLLSIDWKFSFILS